MNTTSANASKVLVTGGSGFLGGWCVIELLNQGYLVRTTLRDLSREAEVRANLATQVDVSDRLEFCQADLLSDDGWAEAVAGCEYVLHVASPFPPAQPKNADDLVIPARDGTLRVLRAGLDGDVKRIVVTSSVAAIDFSGRDDVGRELNEDDWTNPEHSAITPYTKSKTVAELAAWKLVEERGASDRIAVVNPGAIIGPVLSEDRSYSIQLVERMLAGEPAVPKLGFGVVDVRDVAKLEVLAMTAPEAAGKRFVAVSEFAWMADIANVLRERLGDRAKNVPRRTAPNFAVKAMALFDPDVRSIVGDLGKKTIYSAERAKTLLGWEPRPAADSVVDCAESLIETGVVKAA
ncbi:MAG: aldehyde reductase [Thermoleophilaceae bacterium]|nr:aldehyde reductase [Thermoleophilaceae bacterium]